MIILRLARLVNPQE